MEDLQKVIVINTASLSPTVAVWSHNNTLLLIDLYHKYRNKVGTLEIKNMKKLWDVIANDINTNQMTQFTPSHCENRWRVIERNYKKYIDDSNKTGMGRKNFEYAKEMDTIFGSKKNVHPEILLSADTIQHNPIIAQPSDSTNKENNESVADSSASENVRRVPLISKRKSRIQTRNCTLDLMRQDKKEYYKDLLSLHRQKFEYHKEKFQVKVELKTQELTEKRKKNELTQDRNEILKQYLEHHVQFPSDI